ncbi:Inosine/uridine-preferring nucleoside hydrolase domain-containing protein [Gongronella butleri]|nr:Inosine/uridine-preferring nucleoside hydrolase domain-containing protein [Gongronella butleri]
MTRIPVWLDCDPGHDDAMAIMLAAYHPDLHLLGISTVAGNQTVDKTTINAARILKAAGIEGVRVVAGAGKALMRHSAVDEEIHGDTGLDGTDLLPELDASYLYPKDKKAIQVMAEAILGSDEPVALVVTGTMTNVALLVTVYPEVVPKLRCLSFMGGALLAGNRSPVAEFNLLSDPEAAQIVLTSGIDNIVMVPLDVTHTALVNDKVLDLLAKATDVINPRFHRLVRDLLLFFKSGYESAFGFKNGPPLHDPLAVAYLVMRSGFEERYLRVDVDHVSPLCAGQTVVDVWNDSKLPKNCWVTTKVDVDQFWSLMANAWTEAARRSPV